MPTKVTKAAVKRSREMRKNLTQGERLLWAELKKFRSLYGITVRRQAPIGPYFADFVILKHNLIIEVDGEHHFTPEGLAKDAKRDAHLSKLGYRTLRINPGELADNFDGCIETILRALKLA